MKNSVKNLIFIILAVTVVILIASFLSGGTNKEINYNGDKNSLIEKVKAGEVAEIYINGDYVAKIRYNTNSSVTEDEFPRKYDAYAYIPNRNVSELNEAVQSLADKGATAPAISYDNPARLAMLYSFGLPLLLFLASGIVIFIIIRQNRQQNNSALSFGKTKARVIQAVKVRFTDVAGADEEKEELAEIVEFLKNPKKFTDIGARIPKGVLLVGPPGTGKTLLAKAIAGEANVPFFNISGSDFVEMFVGVGASRVRDLFEQAKHNMPCIVFIDEIDAVGRQRGTGLGGGHDEREQTLNQLLIQMDGFENNDGIIVIAATNRADILDPALLRPGRFDRTIYVQVPDVKGREDIFKVHARNKPLASDIDFKNLARLTSGFTGADIENLLNEAAILAARAGRHYISMADINEGINKVIAGPQKKSRVVTERDKRITAYHESGHALVAKKLPHCDEVNEISIIPRGMAAGYTITRPDNDDAHVLKGKLLDDIAMMLAGRAAEEIVLNDISTGASNDIQRATAIARKMVTEWGMSEFGTVYLGSNDHEVFLGRDFAQQAMSPETASRVDEEIKKIIDGCYAVAKKTISDNRAILDNMVALLYEKETIFQDEVDMLFAGKTPAEIIEISNSKAMNKMKDEEERRQKALAEEKAKKEKELEARRRIAAEAINRSNELFSQLSGNPAAKPADGNSSSKAAAEKSENGKTDTDQSAAEGFVKKEEQPQNEGAVPTDEKPSSDGTDNK